MEIQEFAYISNRADAYLTLLSSMHENNTTEALEYKISEVFRQAYDDCGLVYCKKNGDVLPNDQNAEIVLPKYRANGAR